MRIISASQPVHNDRDGAIVAEESVPPAVIEKDLPELKTRHQEAMKKDPTWSMFGGFIDIDNRTYQVAP
jgi:hypothetical protein